MERQFDRDLPEVCDEFMKVETCTSFPNLSTGVCVCVCVVKAGPQSRPCVGGQMIDRQMNQTFSSMSAFLQKRK